MSLTHSAIGLVAVAAVATGVLVAVTGWPLTAYTLSLAGLALGASVVALVDAKRSSTSDADAMQPSFVVAFVTLLLLGGVEAMVVAAAAAVAHGLSEAPHPRRAARTLAAAALGGAGMYAAGEAHRRLGGTVNGFDWPQQGLPIAAAVLVYVLIASTAAGLVKPLFARQRVKWNWFARMGRTAPPYIVAAGLAIAVAETVSHRYWEIVPVAAVPLVLAYLGYHGALSRLEDARRRREVGESLVQGMTVVDRDGAITLWNEALERMVGCSRERAVGNSLVDAVPALGRTDLSKTVDLVLSDSTPRTVDRLTLALPAGPRVLEVRIVPVEVGATLLWHDVTDLVRDEEALRRNEQRLALAADGSTDGWWEWDLRSRQCYFSSRWRALVGLGGEGGAGKPEDWLSRVHRADASSLRAALEAFLSGKTPHLSHEHRLRHEDGSYRWFHCRGAAARGPDDRATRIAGSLTARGEGSVNPERLKGAGFRDPLTGLANRTVFVEGLGRCLAESKLHPAGDRFAVLYLDLDRFKVVNDSLGHLVGDELLTAVSRRLESCLRPDDVLARLGGDEFAILLHGIPDEPQANAVAFRIQNALSAPFSIGGREVFTSASIGIAFGHTQYDNPDEIMRDADIAMYHAKARGKARHELFDADMHARVRDRLGLENDLRHAVSANDFEVHYQPIVLLDSGMCVGLESLIRWTRNGEPVSPATFIPLAEELGLIEPLGTWVLQQACKQFAEWRRQHPGSALDYITVNVSSRQLAQQNFLNIVESAVYDAQLQPCDLRLEVTETALMDSPHAAATLLRDLRDFGVKIYLDDFGTGYSSLSHLHKLPVDALKIDRSFVKSLQHAGRPAIVESILALARTLNTSVVAEGIESDGQAFELERLGCTHAQGYLFSRPLSKAAVDELLRRNEPLGPKRGASTQTADDIPRIEVSSPSIPFAWPASIPLRGPGGESDAA
jgi:diguanylate cyclase (GGDEF)-like protein/PAS domain S-box-containing protein